MTEQDYKLTNMEKDPNFTSLHADPYMVWENNSICRDCLNRIPLEGTQCDVFETVEEVNNAIDNGRCEFYIKKSQRIKDG